MKGDFSQTTKRTLAKRAGEKCSLCKIITGKPHSNPAKAINLGEAAHIRGKSFEPNNRYNSNMSLEEIADITNGIWLCSTCHTAIDSDQVKFPVEFLLDLKARHEKDIENGLFDNDLFPEIKRLSEHIKEFQERIKDKERLLYVSERLFNSELAELRNKLKRAEDERDFRIKQIEELENERLKSGKKGVLLEKAYEYFFKEKNVEKAIETLNEENLISEEKQLANARLLKAKMFSYKLDFKSAEENYERALTIHCDGEIALHFAVFLTQIKKIEKGITILSEALQCAKDDKEKATLYFAIGDLYLLVNLPSKAKDSYRSSYEIFDKLCKQDPSFRCGKAHVLRGYASSLRDIGKFEEAYDAYEEAFLLHIQITIEDDQAELDGLLTVLNGMGNLCLESKIFDMAAGHFRNALMILETEDCNAEPHTKSLVLMNLSNAYTGIKGKEAEAEDCLQEALSELEKLFHKNPTFYLDYYLGAKCELADRYLSKKGFSNALDLLYECLPYVTELEKHNSSAFTHLISTVYNNISDCYQGLNNPGKALEYLDKSIVLLKVYTGTDYATKLRLAETLLAKCKLTIDPNEIKSLATEASGITKTLPDVPMVIFIRAKIDRTLSQIVA